MPALITPKSLQRSVARGFERVENFRKARYMFMEEYVGAFYDKADPGKAQPLNLIFKAVSILVPHLVAKNPEHDVDSEFGMYAGYAEMLELALNKLAPKISYKSTMRMTIIDAIFAMGIIKDGLALGHQTLEDPAGLKTNLAEPYADRVDLDDLTIDPMCRNIGEAVFVGNRIRVTRSFIEESGLYDSSMVQRIPSVGDVQRRGKDVETLSRKTSPGSDENELVDYVDLVEVYLPDDQVIVTVPFGEHYIAKDWLRIVEYDGPQHMGEVPGLGPYHFLGFHWVPNNWAPVPPCGIWYDLHQMANDNAAKADRQARRQKEVLVYGRQAVDDAQEIVDADDGDSVAVDHPDSVKSVSFGGTADDVYRHLQWIDMKFAESGPGDFQQLGGEASGADTATQANILQQAANIRVGDMKDIVYDLTASVSRNLAWYLHTDPLIEMPLKRRIVGGEEVTLFLTPEARQGDFIDFHFKIRWESMDRDNPLLRSQKLTQFVQTVIPTAIQTYAQLQMMGLGHMFNFIKFININARLQGIDHFESVWGDPDFQIMVAEQLAKAPILQGSVAMPEPGQGVEGYGGPRSAVAGSGAGGVPRYQGAGLDPNANPDRAAPQMVAAAFQQGDGNMSGRVGGGLPGV
jgi:hypothetical protein